MSPRPVLCRLADLDATGAKGASVGEWPDELRVVIVRDGNTVRAYQNRCPHMFSSLESRPDHFLDADRVHLVCAVHGARFRMSDGVCVDGPCQGDALSAVSIVVERTDVLLDRDPTERNT